MSQRDIEYRNFKIRIKEEQLGIYSWCIMYMGYQLESSIAYSESGAEVEAKKRVDKLCMGVGSLLCVEIEKLYE